MTVNWAAGLMRWWPHKDEQGNIYCLNHLHPFRFYHSLSGSNGRNAVTVEIHVGFSMHCFTTGLDDVTDTGGEYKDSREARLFHHERYHLSRNLKKVITSLAQRHCAFAKHDNFVTIECAGDDGTRLEYGVFFNLKKQAVANTVLLIVQSAYVLDADKPSPGKGKIGLNALLGHALRGTKPRRP